MSEYIEKLAEQLPLSVGECIGIGASMKHKFFTFYSSFTNGDRVIGYVEESPTLIPPTRYLTDRGFTFGTNHLNPGFIPENQDWINCVRYQTDVEFLIQSTPIHHLRGEYDIVIRKKIDPDHFAEDAIKFSQACLLADAYINALKLGTG